MQVLSATQALTYLISEDLLLHTAAAKFLILFGASHKQPSEIYEVLLPSGWSHHGQGT